jgi:hypothetical protein
MQVIYLIFLNFRIFNLLSIDFAVNQGNSSAMHRRYFDDTAAGLTGQAGSTSPQAGYPRPGGLFF